MTNEPPNNKDAEMMTLGSMISSVDCFNEVISTLEPHDFYYSEHREIFTSLKNLYDRNQPADTYLLSQDLSTRKKLDDAGGTSYLIGLAEYAGISANVEEYAKIVKGSSTLRQAIQAAQRVITEATSGKLSEQEVIENAQSAFFNISNSTETKKSADFSKLIDEEKLSAQEATRYFKEHGKPDASNRLLTSYTDLDYILEGLMPSNLYILAARPSIGKTAFGMNVVENLCLKSGVPVGIFSLEMDRKQIIARLVSSCSEVGARKIRDGNITEKEAAKVYGAFDLFKSQVGVIYDKEGLKISELYNQARRMKELYKIKFLLIDYLQLVVGCDRRSENRYNEVSEVSRKLKELAKYLEIPILCLAQLSRKVEERQGHRPLLSDLRESGSIEQDADVVMLLTRRDYYDAHDHPGEAQLIVAKNRHGPVGEVKLTFRKELTRFDNYTGHRSWP